MLFIHNLVFLAAGGACSGEEQILFLSVHAHGCIKNVLYSYRELSREFNYIRNNYQLSDEHSLVTDKIINLSEYLMPLLHTLVDCTHAVSDANGLKELTKNTLVVIKVMDKIVKDQLCVLLQTIVERTCLSFLEEQNCSSNERLVDEIKSGCRAQVIELRQLVLACYDLLEDIERNVVTPSSGIGKQIKELIEKFIEDTILENKIYNKITNGFDARRRIENKELEIVGTVSLENLEFFIEEYRKQNTLGDEQMIESLSIEETSATEEQCCSFVEKHLFKELVITYLNAQASKRRFIDYLKECSFVSLLEEAEVELSTIIDRLREPSALPKGRKDMLNSTAISAERRENLILNYYMNYQLNFIHYMT